MNLPHHPSFPYRQHIWIATTVTCGVLAMALPDLAGLMRLMSPAIAVLTGALGFAVGWAPLKFHAVLWSSLAPKAMGLLCLAFFYVFSIGGFVNVMGYPFIAAELRSEGVTLAHLMLMIPACVGAAAGAHRVYLDHFVVQQAHARDVRNARA